MQKQGDVIPVVKGGFAYEEAPMSGGFHLRARPPQRGNAAEYERHREYELSIDRHTGTSVVVTLRKILSGTEVVRQRNSGAQAVLDEVYTTTMSFQELANRLLSPGHEFFEDKEALPQVAIDAMKGTY